MSLSTTIFPITSFPTGSEPEDLTRMSQDPNMTTASSAFVGPFENIVLDSNFAWLLCALALVFLWMIYGSCFHSRVIGFIVGSILNQYMKHTGMGELRIGSLKVGVVSGRLAFRNVRYINEDYTVIIYDGYLWFRYWFPYNIKQLPQFKLDSHRLFLHLYGLEVYYYNRTEPVSELHRQTLAYESDLYEKFYGEPAPSTDKEDPKKCEQPKKSNAERINGWFGLRNLFALLDVKLSMFRVVMGNFRAPYSLVVGGTSASLVVTYDTPSCDIDPFSTVITGSMKNMEASFQINPDYPGEPPTCPYDNSDRKGKLKFFSTEAVQLNKYQVDTPTDIITLLLENQPGASEQLMKWVTELTFVGRTDILYGGWIDARRAEMHKALFPPSRSELLVSNTTSQRMYNGFQLALSTKASVYCTIYLLDSQNQVQKFVLSCDPGTELQMFFPFVVRENGFDSTVTFKATHLRGVTSLPSKNLLEADELLVRTTLQYSRVHHGPQFWQLDFTWTNASVFFLYEHKNMIASLIEDWTRDSGLPDLLKFVPFHVNMDMKFNGFELITYANQYNWVDCSKNGAENIHVVFGGPQLNLALGLNYLQFLLPVNEIPFTLSAPHVDVSMFFPESHTQLYTIASVYQRARMEDFGGKPVLGMSGAARPFRDLSNPSALWCQTWVAENFGLTLNYCYHNTVHTSPGELLEEFSDDEGLEPDVMELEMSIASCQLMASGALIKALYNTKENYFGASQDPNSFESNLTRKLEALLRKSLALFEPVVRGDETKRRPMEVNMMGHFSDTTCHLLKPCEAHDPVCPRVFAKTIILEVLKQHEETTLQVLIYPIVVEIPDPNPAEYTDPMQNGQLLVSFVQVRGHAMFSDVDIPSGEETIEYGWLLDIQVGDVVCRATLPQIAAVSTGLEALVLTLDDVEDDYIRPEVMRSCIHGLAQPLCSYSSSSGLCPEFEDIKYRMTRFSIDALHIYVMDSDSFAYLKVEPVWLSTCNLRSPEHEGGLSLLIPSTTLKQFVWSSVTPLADQDVWMEATSFKLGVVEMDAAFQLNDSTNTETQLSFLKKHDDHTRRLRFLWEDSSGGKFTRCACFGGSEFFGRAFTKSTWKGLSEFVDLAHVINDSGLEVGQRIFETAENGLTTNEIISLESLLATFSTSAAQGGKFQVVSPRPPEVSSAPHRRFKGEWIPEQRRPSVGSMESFYSAAETQEDTEEISENPVVPDILRDLDRVSIAAVSQTTISTISMAPDRSQPMITMTNFPVNLHTQLSKKTQESPLLMAGYVAQIALWQRGVINVTIVGSGNATSGDGPAKFSFYLPNFQKVKGGLEMADAFKAKTNMAPAKPARTQLFPRHYRTQASSASSRFVDFGTDKDGSTTKRPTRMDLHVVGSSDLMITPISCDALLPMVQSLQKYVTELRPSIFLNKLYRQCVASSRSLHRFDDDKVMVAKIYENLHKAPARPAQPDTKKYRLPLTPLIRDADLKFPSSNSAAESNSTIKADVPNHLRTAAAGNFLFGEQPWIEKSFVYQQFSLNMDQVNVVTLQCGIVEEVVGTKDLSSPRDLICVSVLTGSFRAPSLVCARKSFTTYSAKIYTDQRGSRALVNYDRKAPAVQLSPLSGMFELPDIVGAESKSDVITDSLLSFSVQAGHFQLRRLRHSDIWRKAKITCITENRSQAWFDYQPKQSPLEEGSPYRKIFSDLSGTDQVGFIVLELGVDEVKVEGGGRTESDEHLDHTVPLFTKQASTLPEEPVVGRASPKSDNTPTKDTDSAGSRHSGSSTHTFIAHASQDDLNGLDGLVSTDVGFKLSVTTTGLWLNCPTPSKRTTAESEREQQTESQIKGFTRLDWHFLSTANPMVDAWLYPLDRANVAFKSLAAVQHRNDIVLSSYFLILAVNEHILPKPSKMNLARHTLKSRVLQEDCCSRLARILQYHGLHITPEDIEHNFEKDLLPPVDILEKSIFVLFKQLRYTPFARVLLESPFLLQKFKPVFRQRDPATLDSSTGGLDDVDGTMEGGEDDVLFSTEPRPRKHPESPYPPFEQDLNVWLDEEKRVDGPAKMAASKPPTPKLPHIDPNEDSDSPYEDGEFGPVTSGPEFQASVEHIFAPLLEQLGLQKKSTVSLLKTIVGFHVSGSMQLDSIRIGLVESVDFDGSGTFSSKESFNRISAFRCSQVTIAAKALLDIPIRSLELFIPDYNERVLLTSRVNRITVLTYKFDIGEVAQAVSMPLLRLLAQIFTVITSMQRVRANLKKNWPEINKKGHRKTDSTSTSGSGTSHSDSPAPRTREHDTHMDFVSAESSHNWKAIMTLMDLYAKPAEYRVVDETKARARRISSNNGPNRIRGPTRLSFRKRKKGSSSDNISSSGNQSDEIPETPDVREKPLTLDENSDVENESEGHESVPQSSSRAYIDAAVERRLKKTIRFGTEFAVCGIASIHNMKFEASLRGLNFQAVMSALSFNHSYAVRKSRSNHLDESYYQLRTGQLSVQLVQKMGLKGQLYLGMGLGSTQLVYSTSVRNSKIIGQKSLCVRVGDLHFSVPHHPITLHSMVVRGAEDLTDAIEDLKTTAGIKLDGAEEVKPTNESTDKTPPAEAKPAPQPPAHVHHKQIGYYPIKATIYFKKLIITAAPLPSLEASYEISKLIAYGTIGNITVMHFDFGPQDLVFKSKNEDIESTANFQVPSVYVKTSYEPIPPVKVLQDDGRVMEFKDAHALYVTAKAGSPDYTFNTDALKYTVLFQKVFMKEIEDVLDTLSQPIIPQQQFKIPLPKRKQGLPFFHQINVQQDGIRITGTTPTSSAVRLEIDKTAVYVSNIPKTAAMQTCAELENSSVVSVQVDLGICLGQLVQGEQQMYEEADPDFQPYAHFRTRMTFTNYGEGPLEALLQGYDARIRRKRIVAHLNQPRIYFQPRAVDMAVIFYINYKNAYDYWHEQRHGPAAPASNPRDMKYKRSVSGHLPQVVAQRAIQSIQESIYVIELFISQMYVCMPLPASAAKNSSERDVDTALLISLDRTKVRAVLAESIITSGSFDLFRLCFTEDRGPQYDYTGRPDDGFTNCCFVPKGYVEVTSRTTKKETTESGLPKWELYFKWDMNGIEMHVDPAIGKIVSNLSDAMTLFTGEENDLNTSDVSTTNATTPEDVFRYPPTRDRMEKQMKMHAKIFSDLQSEGASVTEIGKEAEKLKKIEQGIVHELRKDLVKRIRQKSISSKGSISDQRTHRRTSSTPQSDLSPTTPDADPTHARTFSADHSRKSQLKTTNMLSTPLSPRRGIPESPKDEAISPRGTSAPETQQSFDFDFTVLINIESGHCTFYCGPDKDKKRGLQSASSVDVSSGATSPARRGSDYTRRANLFSCCTLYIPGVNLELQYESDVSGHNLRGLSKSPENKMIDGKAARPANFSPAEGEGRRLAVGSGKKKGNLFATFSLESLPAETVLTPQLLDFIEQALEPIPIISQSLIRSQTVIEEEPDADVNQDESWGFESAVESFPVDIFVLFMMNSTKIRCSCLPVSKVEGVLTLPSLSMMVSTRKYSQMIDAEKLRNRTEYLSSNRPVLETLDEMLHQMGPESYFPDFVDKFEEQNGLGLYGNLSGFSLVIFHPYGTVSDTAYYDPATDRGGGKGGHMPDKRELVRLELDRLHVELVRSKAMVDDIKLTSSTRDGSQGAHSIEFSASVSVGKTTFWYDLRRLGEILAFPKAWYRRSIARRFFLGEEAADNLSNAGSLGSTDHIAENGQDTEEDGPIVLPKTAENGMSNGEHDEAVLPWKTIVLVVLRVSALDFNVNMGNVMGNTVLLVEDINCIGRFSAASDGHTDMFVAISTTNLDLNSRGGVVGGGSQWKKAQVYGHIRNEMGTPPMHAFGCLMNSAESRLEYMGAVSALARMSKMNVRVGDTWALQTNLQAKEVSGGPQLSATVSCTWDQMQVIICSASTSHVVKSFVRVTEFFEEQLKSSRQFISNLNFAGPVAARRRSSLSKAKESSTSLDSRFHRHWQKPLEFLRGYRLKSVPLAPFPQRGGLLKGGVHMNGRNISLACFYGNSFRGKSWARFSIKEPRLAIKSEALHAVQKSEIGVDVVQEMSFHLGKEEGSQFAATVARVTCNNPPPLLNLPDWFEFMFMNSELDEIGRFPTTHSQKGNAFEDLRLSMTIETILALPTVVISLRSEHAQSEFPPEESATPPVLCNFSSDFGAPISIDMGDSQAFYFLHQLINSYLANTDAESVASKREVPNPTEVLKKDARSFQVNEWYLQPSFKLLQRIGRDIETIGVERVMNRLGFAQAQTTIPKWIQRGLVDPVDKGLAALILLLMKGSKHDRV